MHQWAVLVVDYRAGYVIMEGKQTEGEVVWLSLISISLLLFAFPTEQIWTEEPLRPSALVSLLVGLSHCPLLLWW